MYCRDTAQWQNNELEKQIMNLQENLRQTDYAWDGDEDLVKENTKHKLLLESIDSLKEQLPMLRDRIRNAKICGPGEFDKLFLKFILGSTNTVHS